MNGNVVNTVARGGGGLATQARFIHQLPVANAYPAAAAGKANAAVLLDHRLS